MLPLGAKNASQASPAVNGTCDCTFSITEFCEAASTTKLAPPDSLVSLCRIVKPTGTAVKLGTVLMVTGVGIVNETNCSSRATPVPSEQ